MISFRSEYGCPEGSLTPSVNPVYPIYTMDSTGGDINYAVICAAVALSLLAISAILVGILAVGLVIFGKGKDNSEEYDTLVNS